MQIDFYYHIKSKTEEQSALARRDLQSFLPSNAFFIAHKMPENADFMQRKYRSAPDKSKMQNSANAEFRNAECRMQNSANAECRMQNSANAEFRVNAKIISPVLRLKPAFHAQNDRY